MEKKKVHVWSIDMLEYWGLGRVVGYVTTYGVNMGKKIIIFPNPEQPPPDEYLEEVDGELIVHEGNPKIVLDDGRIVYGTQVHRYEDE